MEEEGELVIDEGSGIESEEGECSSDDEKMCNLLGVPIECREDPKLPDVMETKSEREEERRERDVVGEEENGDRIRPDKLMQLG